MNDTLKNKALTFFTILISSVVLSTLIFTKNSFTNVKPCLQSPTCDSLNSEIGELTVKEFGFPRAYRSTSAFEPENKNKYASASIETKGISYFIILINTIFWASLLYVIYLLLIKSRVTTARLRTSDSPELDT